MVERSELGGRLLTALTAPGSGDVGLTTGLQGAGGFGKTVLATWACHQPDIDQRFAGGLLWVTIGQEIHGADLAGKINDLAFVVSGQRPAIADPDTAGAELGRLLQEQEPVLLVIDDVWTDSQLRPFRFGAATCRRLVTTRIPDLLPEGGSHISVNAMSDGQARELVVDGVPGLGKVAAERLATVAGRWPVLLNLINGALRRRVARGQSPNDAANEIVDQLVQRGPAALDPARPADRTQAVAATVGASLALLTPAAQQRYLDLVIFPEDVDIPLDVLRLLWSDVEVEALCDELVGLGLVAECRLDLPGPRLVMHDVMRAYLRARVRSDDRAQTHKRLIEAAASLLPAGSDDSTTPWWTLPASAGYLWRYLPYHLREGGERDALARLVCDLRWVEAKIQQLGSVVGVEADLEQVDTPTVHVLRRALRQAAHLLGPIDPPAALGATLASRLHGVTGLEAVLEPYRATLVRPRLEALWPLPGHANLEISPEVEVGHTGGLTSCAFSPEGSLLATTGDDGSVLLWQLSDGHHGTLTGALAGHTGGVWDCAFSPNNALLATASNDRTARVWRTMDGSVHLVLSLADVVTDCAFSPDGTLLATTSADGTVRLWQVADGHPVLVLAAHEGRVSSCAFSPDGTLLATTGNDGTMRLWQVADGALRAHSTGDHRQVWRCAFSPDGTLLATVGPDTVQLWEVASDHPPSVLAGHGAVVLGCAFSPDGRVLATSGVDGTARLWTVADRTERAVLSGRSHRVNDCAFSPDGTLLATASIDGTTQLRTMPAGTVHATLRAHAAWARSCMFSPDGTLLATAGNDGQVRIWETASGTLHTALVGHANWRRGCTFSPDGTILATTGDRLVGLWDVTTGAILEIMAGHTDMVADCAFSPDGALLATVGEDATARLWDIATATPKAILTGHADWVRSCAFSPDGRLLATSSGDCTVRLWNVSTGTEHAVLTGHTSWADACAFSPNGDLLASAGHDGTVRLWNLPAGERHCVLRVAGPLVGLAWHPNGEILCAVGGAGIHMLRLMF